MLSKAFARPQMKNVLNVMQRGVYTKETQPAVFINEHTKVIVQGMTGKHVSIILRQFIFFHRELSTLNNRLNTELTLLVESIKERLVLNILVSQFSVTLLKLRTLLELMPLFSTSHHHSPLMLSLKLLRPRWNLLSASPKVSQLLI
jgi:hypothetical protein